MYNVCTLIWESTEVTCLSWTAKNNNKILLSNVYVDDTIILIFNDLVHFASIILPLCEKPLVLGEIKWVMISH